jgi:hypothetical protein
MEENQKASLVVLQFEERHYSVLNRLQRQKVIRNCIWIKYALNPAVPISNDATFLMAPPVSIPA